MLKYFEIGTLAYGEMLFKRFTIFRLDDHLFQQSGTILASLVQGLQRTILLNYFEIEPLADEEMSFKDSSIFSSGGHFV